MYVVVQIFLIQNLHVYRSTRQGPGACSTWQLRSSEISNYGNESESKEKTGLKIFKPKGNGKFSKFTVAMVNLVNLVTKYDVCVHCTYLHWAGDGSQYCVNIARIKI